MKLKKKTVSVGQSIGCYLQCCRIDTTKQRVLSTVRYDDGIVLPRCPFDSRVLLYRLWMVMLWLSLQNSWEIQMNWTATYSKMAILRRLTPLNQRWTQMITKISLASRTQSLSFMWVALKHNAFFLCVLEIWPLLTELQWKVMELYCLRYSYCLKMQLFESYECSSVSRCLLTGRQQLVVDYD